MAPSSGTNRTSLYDEHHAGNVELARHRHRHPRALVVLLVGSQHDRERVRHRDREQGLLVVLRTAYEGEFDGTGLDPNEALSLSDAEAALAASLVRSGRVSVAAAARSLGKSEQETRAMLGRLAARGVVEEQQTPDGPLFSARLASRRARSSSVWRALADDPSSVSPVDRTRPAPSQGISDRRAVLLGQQGRFVLSLLPLVMAFLLGEWFVITDTGSFPGLS